MFKGFGNRGFKCVFCVFTALTPPRLYLNAVPRLLNYGYVCVEFSLSKMPSDAWRPTRLLYTSSQMMLKGYIFHEWGGEGFK